MDVDFDYMPWNYRMAIKFIYAQNTVLDIRLPFVLQNFNLTFNARCQFTPLLILHSIIFGFGPILWFISISFGLLFFST
jgi:hypothetical protein